MAIRRCPVCRMGIIRRADAKTCSRVCAKEWRDWPPNVRHKAEYDAEHGLEDRMAALLSQKEEGVDYTEDDVKRASSNKPYEDPREAKTFDLDAILGKLEGLKPEDKLKAMLPAGEDLTDEDRRLIEEKKERNNKPE